jgi:ABC-2 type transport system permease protein
MTTWWRGTLLVLERGLVDQLRSKAFKIVTAVLLLVSVGAVVVPQFVGGGGTTYTLATVGAASPELTSLLDASADAGDFTTEYVTRAGDAEVRDAVRAGDATVGLVGDRMYVAERNAGIFPALVAQAAVGLETTRLLTEFGLSTEQVRQLQTVQPPEQVAVAAVADTDRAGVGYAVGLVLYLALLFSGQMIATIVATEKSTRISEVLLAVLRPSQVLVGTVLAVGVVTLFQLLVLAGPVLVGASLTDASWLPPVAGPDLAFAIIWFVLGFLLYAFLYAAGGALVEKVTEAGTAVLPITMLIITAYMLGIFTATESPNAPWSVITSIFPLSAPLTMPIRWSSGEVPGYQLALALALTALAALGCVWLASGIYRRALVITGHRVKFRELLSRRERPQDAATQQR